MIKYLYLDFEIEDYNLSVRKKNKSEIGNPAKVEESKFLSVAINVGEGTKRGNPVFIDLRDLEKGVQELAETLVNRNFDFADGVVVVHNAPYDIPLLKKLGVDPKSIVDTMSLAALNNSREPSYSLGDLGEKYLGLKKLEAPNFDRNTDMDKLSEYNLRDVEITEKLHIFYSKNIGREMSEVIKLEAKSTEIVCNMMENGVRLDREWLLTFLEDSKEEWETRLNRSKSFGVENPNSSKQIIEYLAGHGITPPEKTKTGNPSVGRESIERMLKEYREMKGKPRKFLESLVEFKALDKRRSFAEGLIARSVKFASFDDRSTYDFLYPAYRTLKGESFTSGSGLGGTGSRFSSSSPNMQQFESGRKDPEQVLRKSILPLRPFETLYSLDYKAQEIRMFIHLVKLGERHLYHNEQRILNELIDKYNRKKNFDFYEYLMEKGNPYLLRPRKRYEWKQVTLAKMYGLSNAALAVKLEIPKLEVEKINQAFFQALPFYGSINRRWKSYMEQNGYIPTILKRRMYGERDKSYRAINYRVQGSSSDQMKMAMVKCYENYGILPYITIHDELVVSLADEKDLEKVIYAMKEAINLCIPVEVDVKKGKNFGEMEEISV